MYFKNITMKVFVGPIWYFIIWYFHFTIRCSFTSLFYFSLVDLISWLAELFCYNKVWLLYSGVDLYVGKEALYVRIFPLLWVQYWQLARLEEWRCNLGQTYVLAVCARGCVRWEGPVLVINYSQAAWQRWELSQCCLQLTWREIQPG